MVTLNLLRAMARNSRGGRFDMEAVPLNYLIQLAYNVKDFQVLGGPSWANSNGYDIIAKAEGNATFDQMRPMLQSLLTDRFKLRLRRETKEIPVYELVVAKGGLKLMASKDGSCVTFDPNSAPPPYDPKKPRHLCGAITRQMVSVPERKDRIEAFGISMPGLIDILSDEVGRTVLDMTGFTETFDFNLEFVSDKAIGNTGLGPAPIGNPGRPAPSINLSGPSIFDSLQKQLGLRLESAKGPAEMLVIDSVERPSEN
jgi:uncharacterized protein (TIGR03435 family)